MYISLLYFSAMNAVNCNTRNNPSPIPRAVLREPVLNTYKHCIFVYLKIKKTNLSILMNTMKPPVLVLIRYGQVVQMFIYLSFGIFSVQTTHNCNRKKFCYKKILV